ncbi:MAG: response regulator [Nitrospirae bacterium]|nr:response regulator [Nitrospirota bacterium]
MVKKILIVDKDEATRNLVSYHLTRLDYEVYTAVSSKSAINKAIHHVPDILIFDVATTKKDGFGILKEIRSYKDLRNIIAIVVTASANKEDVINAIRMGANDYVLKPLKIGNLLAKLVQWSNTEMEEQWKSLQPEQENTLRLIKVTIERVVDSVKHKEPLPYEDIVNAVEVLENTIKEFGAQDILSAVYGYNNTMFLHSLLVAVFMYLFAELKGFDSQECKLMTIGGLMHDLGNVLIPNDLLFKPDKLDPEEYKNIKEHVNYIMDILNAMSGVPEIVKDICWSHHEKMDGSGYPRGLKGSDINTPARMLAVVEAYAALTTKNVYRETYATEDAVKMLFKPEGHLDPELIKDFERSLLNGFKTKNKEKQPSDTV